MVIYVKHNFLQRIQADFRLINCCAELNNPKKLMPKYVKKNEYNDAPVENCELIYLFIPVVYIVILEKFSFNHKKEE